jgi:glycolate oxidase FAD binding subunit
MAHGAVGAPSQRVGMTIVSDSVETLRDRIRGAIDQQTPVRVSGGATWLDAGRPVRASEHLSTRELAGITEYIPGDLTLTARAGTTLGEIRDATATHGQWLALDPYGSDDGTIGATIATASAGPLSTAFGTPRDLVLGVEFVTGNGVIARGGGRVVKNVAGFDLTRLLTGSWGTLGVITEATVRLHARPQADESMAVRLGDGAGDIDRLRLLLRRLPFTPYACEIVNDALGRRLANLDGVTAIIRLGGNHQAVDAQRAAFGELGNVRDLEPSVWQRLRAAEPARAFVLRLSAPSSEIATTWREALAFAASFGEVLLHATPARGIVRCIVNDRPESAAALERALEDRSRVTRIAERLPATAWALCPSSTADRISSGIKRAFDPHGVLNPGILGEVS